MTTSTTSSTTLASLFCSFIQSAFTDIPGVFSVDDSNSAAAVLTINDTQLKLTGYNAILSSLHLFDLPSSWIYEDPIVTAQVDHWIFFVVSHFGHIAQSSANSDDFENLPSYEKTQLHPMQWAQAIGVLEQHLALRQYLLDFDGTWADLLAAFFLAPVLQKNKLKGVHNIYRWYFHTVRILLSQLTLDPALEKHFAVDPPTDTSKYKSPKQSDLPPFLKKSKGKPNKSGKKTGSDPSQNQNNHTGQQKKKAKKPKKPAAKAVPSVLLKAKLLVGLIEEVGTHPTRDNLFVTKMNLGEAEPRTICAGLIGKVPASDLLNTKVVVFANLGDRDIEGIPSQGMILCATSSDENQIVTPIRPPESSIPGLPVVFAKHRDWTFNEDNNVWIPSNTPDTKINSKNSKKALKLFNIVNGQILGEDSLWVVGNEPCYTNPVITTGSIS